MARFLLMFKAFGISVFWDVLFLDIVGLTSMNWNQSPGKGLDSILVWSCPWWQAAGSGGYLSIPSACCLCFFPCGWKCWFPVLSGWGMGPDCRLRLRNEQQFRVTGLLWVSGWGARRCSTWRLCYPTGRLQRSCQQQRDPEWRDCMPDLNPSGVLLLMPIARP